MNSERCRILEWDSHFFGRKIARLEGSHLRADELAGIEQWCARERVECLYFLADSRCADTLAEVEAHGFGLKDIRMTYEWKAALGARGIHPEIGERVVVREHRETDIERLVEVARAAHTDSRFFFDRQFDRDKAASLYERWIRKACAEDYVLVGEIDNLPAGYLSCAQSSAVSGSIGLAAVDSRFHGQGIGRAMIETALRWFTDRRIADISVVTQGRNVAAHRFYQSAGFLTRGIECWFHKWFDSAPQLSS